MGLPEKRIISQYQQENFPKFQAEITSIVGKEIPVEVKWDTLFREDSARYLLEVLEKVYFLPVLEGLKAICIDSMGKEAVAGSVKKILIENNENSPEYGGQDITFSDGLLHIDQRPENIDDIGMNGRTADISKALEAGL